MNPYRQDISYTITFLSDWHCGTGLAAGADVDLLAAKDCDGLPYIPGKTIKGLVRENVELLQQLNRHKVSNELIYEGFGFFDNANNMSQGCMFFNNANLPDFNRQQIVKHHAAEYIYRSIASTAIDDSGICKDHTLRKIQVVPPCTLEGTILDVPAGLVDTIKDALKLVKRIGTNRNRGLGRCQIDIIVKEGGKQ